MTLRILILLVISVLVASCASSGPAYEDYESKRNADGKQEFQRYKEAVKGRNPDYKAAARHLTKMIKFDAQDYDAYYMRGNVFLHQEKYKYAIADYEKAIEIYPDHYIARVGLAQCYAGRNDSTTCANDPGKCSEDSLTALKYFNEAIEMAPKKMYPVNNRASFYMSNEQYDLALIDYQTAFNNRPANYANIYFERGICYHELKQFDSALADYNEFEGYIKLEWSKPNYPAQYKRLPPLLLLAKAGAYAQLGDKANMLEMLEKVLEDVPAAKLAEVQKAIRDEEDFKAFEMDPDFRKLMGLATETMDDFEDDGGF